MTGLADAIEEVRPSIAQLRLGAFMHGDDIAWLDEIHARPLGTGFFVGDDGWIVTALHVANTIEDGITASRGSSVTAWIAPKPSEVAGRGQFVGQNAVVVDRDPVHDLALLQLQNKSLSSMLPESTESPPYEVEPIRIATARPRDGTFVAVSGYPLGEPTLVTASGTIASAWTYIPQPDPTGRFPERYLADVTANPATAEGQRMDLTAPCLASASPGNSPRSSAHPISSTPPG